MYLASSTITWGQLRRQEDPAYTGVAGHARILDEIREAGYSHVTAGARKQPGPPGGEDPMAHPEDQLHYLRDHGLLPAPPATGGYALRDRAQLATNVENVRGVAAFTAALGLDAVFLMPEPDPSHRASPGQYPNGGRPDRPGADDVAATCEALNRMGEACRAEGVWLCLHNHAGMFWETDEEFEEVIQGTDPALVGLGPDVGHMVFGGIEPLSWFRRHMDRVKSIHIKDIDLAVLETVRRERLPMPEALARNIWVEIGSGGIPWPDLFRLWQDAGYDGAVIVESDRTPLPTPLESVAQSRRYLRDITGI